MDVKQLVLLAAVAFCINATIVSAELPYVTVSEQISPEDFWSLSSGQVPDQGRITLTVKGHGDPIRLPIQAVLAIDSSGSMENSDPKGNRLKAAESFVNMMDPTKDKIGIISWDSDINFRTSITNNFSDVVQKIYEVDSSGGTNLNLGLNTAIDLLSEQNDVLKTVIFLSDGEGTYTSSGMAGSPADRAKSEGITIYTIGLNVEGTTEKNLKDIADTTGGRYYNVQESSSLKSFYEGIGEAITNVAGRNVEVRYALPSDTIIENYSIRPKEEMKSGNKVLSWNAGTISIDDTWSVSFDISFRSGGIYTVGISPDSNLIHTLYDGTRGNADIPRMNVMVTDVDPFALTGKAVGGVVNDSATNVVVTKKIVPNELETCPDINLTVKMPDEPYDVDVVFALDSSPSMKYTQLVGTMSGVVGGLINQPEFNDVRISVVSWDEGTPDFVTPLTRVIGRNYSLDPLDVSDEEDHTVYGDGLRPAIDVLEKEGPVDLYTTRRIIVFVTGESEFSLGDWDAQLDRAARKGYIVYAVGMQIDKKGEPIQYNNLMKVSQTGGKFYSINDFPKILGVVSKIKEELDNLSIAENIIVTDTLYPYLVVGENDVEATNGNETVKLKPLNSDGSTTLVWNLGEMKRNETETLTIHPSLLISIPAEVNSKSRSNEIYGIGGTTPNSNIEYTWLIGESKGTKSMELPEGVIWITCGMPSKKPETSAALESIPEPESEPLAAEEPMPEKSDSIPGFQAWLSFGGLLAAVYAFRRR